MNCKKSPQIIVKGGYSYEVTCYTGENVWYTSESEQTIKRELRFVTIFERLGLHGKSAEIQDLVVLMRNPADIVDENGDWQLPATIDKLWRHLECKAYKRLIVINTLPFVTSEIAWMKQGKMCDYLGTKNTGAVSDLTAFDEYQKVAYLNETSINEFLTDTLKSNQFDVLIATGSYVGMAYTERTYGNILEILNNNHSFSQVFYVLTTCPGVEPGKEISFGVHPNNGKLAIEEPLLTKIQIQPYMSSGKWREGIRILALAY